MKGLSNQEITSLLKAWNLGREDALAELVPLVYAELHRIAGAHMAGEKPGHTLQTSALLNEAYLRIAQLRQIQWQDRNHFYAIASRLMRRILVDFARSRQAVKRGAGMERVSLDEGRVGDWDRSSQLLAVEQGLRNLQQIDERKAKVIELRFFGGLTVKETAKVLQIAPATVMRDWDFAKAWLHRELST